MTPKLTLPPASNKTTTVFEDEYLNEVFRKEYEVRTTIDATGAASTSSIGTSIVLMDGTLWNQSMRDHPLVMCHSCRNPPRPWLGTREPVRHGLLLAANSVRCADCGAIACPHHRRSGRDGAWFCVQCRPGGIVRGLVDALFYEEVDE